MAAAARTTARQRRQSGGGREARGRERQSLGWYIAAGVAISAVFVVPRARADLRRAQGVSPAAPLRSRAHALGLRSRDRAATPTRGW
jgi:hypothetical protein